MCRSFISSGDAIFSRADDRLFDLLQSDIESMSDKKQSKLPDDKERNEDADVPQQVPWLNPNEIHALQRSTDASSTVKTTPIDDLEAKKTAMSQTTPSDGTFAELMPDTTPSDRSTTERKNLDAKPRASEWPGEESKVEETAFVAEEHNLLNEAPNYVPAVASLPPRAEMLSIQGPSSVIESSSNTGFQEVRPGAVAIPGPGPERSMSDVDEELGGGEDFDTISTPVPQITARVVEHDDELLQEENLRLRAERENAAVAQVITEDASSRKFFDSPRSKCAAVMGAILVLVVIIAAVVLSVVLTGGKDSPTPAPTIAPVDTQALEDLIAAASPDQGDALRNSSTPQNKALAWLIANNTNLGSYSDKQKIQRYALATLYYSTGGDNWTSQRGWLSDDDECRWYNPVVSGDVCNTDGDLVTLDLSSNNLQGTLPAEISMLSDSLGKLLLAIVLSFPLFVLNSSIGARD